MIKQRIINTVPWTYVISDFTSEETVETFNEKELSEKVIARKDFKLYVKWKGFEIYLLVGLIKKILTYIKFSRTA